MENDDLDNLFGDNESNNVENSEKPTLVNQEKSAPESLLNDFILTDQDKLALVKLWDENPENPPSIEELCEKIRPGKGYDGRSRLGREIKKYISSLNLPAPKTKTEYEKKNYLDLSEEEKQFIFSNSNMRAAEIASALWNKPYFANNSQEVRTILNYQKELEKTTSYKKETNDDEIETFRPPKTLEHACARINRHVDGANFDPKKLTSTQKKQCLTLISYMHSFRFAHYFDLINEPTDRSLFQNTFVKYIYDKLDLSQEDLDQYLALANEAVMESSIRRTISMLEAEQQKGLNETGKISMTIVEALKTSRDELNACRNRHDKLYKTLDTERSKRMDGKLKDNATVLNLIEAWKQKDQRDQMILLANKRQEKLSTEIDRLENMDELKVRILGISKGEILEG